MLKILELQKSLDEKRAAFADLEKVDFTERRSALQMQVDNATEEMTEEERAEIEQGIENLNAEEAAHEEAKSTLKGEIEQIEREIAEEEAKAPKDTPTNERKVEKMETREVRDSKEYIRAYANFIKTGKVDEVRALLTENATNGTVPVPTFVYDVVKQAWNREGIMARVRKTFLKGNLKIGFEVSATGAVVHTEGGEPVSEEALVLGVVNLVPETIKKWISFSDEVMDMGAEEFLAYIYDELTYRIAQKAADLLIEKILACDTVSTGTMVGVPTIAVSSIGVGTIANALGLLSGSAANPVIMMNKQTWSAFKQAQYAAQYPVDPFEGLPVEFNDSITAFNAATTGVAFAIIGDLGYGAHANMPNGDVVQLKYDDVTLMTSDLVRVLGRKSIAVAPVAPNAFVTLTMAE